MARVLALQLIAALKDFFILSSLVLVNMSAIRSWPGVDAALNLLSYLFLLLKAQMISMRFQPITCCIPPDTCFYGLEIIK